MSRFAARLAAREATLFGTWVKIPALETVELLAHAGFDYLVLDLEHAPLSLERAYAATVVAQGMGLGVLARVPDQSASHVQRLLDMGLDGLLVPRVADAAGAARAVSSMVFEPEGRRGMGSTSRAGRWGLDSNATYLKRDVVRGVQLEDREALAGIAAIARTPRLSAVFLGLGDLQLSTGLAASSPELTSLVDGVLRECRPLGIPVGTAVGNADAARKAAQRGFDFVMVSNDASLFARAAADLMAAVKA